MSSNKKKDKNIGQIIFMLIMLFAGMACGSLAGRVMGKAAKEGEFFWGSLFVLAIAIYLAMFIQIVIHEAGHLVFGLLTGYQFSSFRIASFMFIKEDGKIRLRRYSLAGTGGQCLMSPPDLVDGKMPIVLYNLGGCIMNLIATLLFVVIGILTKENEVLHTFCSSMAVMGIAYALSNGIPMKVGPISNDGHNALSLGKNPVALHAFWLQLKINEQVSKGKRLKELPESWFKVPADEAMQDGLVAALAVFRANWLMDQGRLEEVSTYITQLLNKETGILGLHRSLLINDSIFCKLVVDEDIEGATRLHDKAHEKFVKQMKNNPSIIRSEYAYALLVNKDEKKAEELLKRFDKIAKTYPYPNDIISEREVMNLV